MDGLYVFHRRPDAGADAFHSCVFLRDPRRTGLAGAGLEMGTHLRRDSVALRLAVYGLPMDETSHHVVDGTDRGKEIGRR